MTDIRGGAEFSIAERERNLVWILGSSRSGSSWTLRMLADLPGVVGLDDPHLGHHLGVWRPIALAWTQRERLPDLRILPEVKRDKPDYFFSDEYRDAWLPALRRMVAERFDAQARDRARERGIADPTVVVKEPGSQAAEIIMSMFPRAGLIFLLRDGRDVVDSWLDAYKSGLVGARGGRLPGGRRGPDGASSAGRRACGCTAPRRCSASSPPSPSRAGCSCATSRCARTRRPR